MASGCSSCLGDGPSEVEALINKHGIDCEFVRNGTLHCATGSRASPRSRAPCVNGGRAGRRSNTRLAKRPRGASASISMPVFARMRAGTIQPLAYARGLANAALAAGAGIHTQSPVRSAERTGKAWRLRRPTAEWWRRTGSSSRPTPMPKARSGRKASVSRSASPISTSPPGRSRRNSGLDPAGTRGLLGHEAHHESFRFDNAGRLLFGSIGALRLAGLEVHRAWAKRAVKKTFPQIGWSNSRRNGTG